MKSKTENTKQTTRSTAEQALADLISGKIGLSTIRYYMKETSGLTASRRNMYAQSKIMYQIFLLEQKLKELQEDKQ
ncbi:TPA: hypothetical protein PXM11_004198 [Yersinia enterocolitica]|uniref:Uncharacterized protein n=1 Tax=Yersinia enterocolitica TaxID=630 RepID=A0ABP1YFN3_YEREN|nr:hypothetical protein [Yersinia enterocolitica]AOF15864.1 hypothetical protein BB936_16615 [Yersinia enterocolitica]AOF19931.1 hypothetical protein BED34_16275 [Yersinia enterocolitica]AOF24466.1 hypothetical protein BED33_18970 [Yersinia enterocolitica]AOF28106.1 hypothetical protein BED32_15880 [Yersinia enterocolitica]AOF32282.1 hypothetical protein BED35_16740 [Yersinia enterocolitica]